MHSWTRPALLEPPGSERSPDLEENEAVSGFAPAESKNHRSHPRIETCVETPIEDAVVEGDVLAELQALRRRRARNAEDFGELIRVSRKHQCVMLAGQLVEPETRQACRAAYCDRQQANQYAKRRQVPTLCGYRAIRGLVQ